MEIDHLFFLTTPAAPEIAKLEALGLTPTYRRTHVGQGSANVCYCFENAFLEVLWVTSPDEARSAAVARMQLSGRAAWRTDAASPFGIAWRGAVEDSAPIATRPCTPPYLPPGAAIEVATDSDDIMQPLMFTFPGSRAPREWPESRRGALQAAGGFTTLELDTVWLPSDVRPTVSLRRIVDSARATLQVSPENRHAMDVTMRRTGTMDPLRVRLPECEILS